MTILFYIVSDDWQIIIKPQPNLYSGDTCLSPEGVPWREVPLYTRDPVYTTRVSYFPRVSRSGPVWWSFWVERLLRVWLVSRSFPLLFTVLLCLPTAQALYITALITAGSLVALYNGQCMITCITKMISDRRWQRGLSYEHVFSVSQACPFSVVAWKRSRK